MKATIGIEVHVELKSKSKVFSNSKNRFDDLANSNVSLIDYGYPGVLPKLNKGVIDLALKACLGCNCKINKEMTFDRKNYFYPDLPKGYQITQKDTPIGYDGFVKISNKNINLERIHIEEDTCKSIHSSATLLNYNRSGVPLIEIVTTPCISNGEEAIEYLENLRNILLYLDISDVKIEEGSMRCDVNVSVSDTDVLGTKCEVKNIGSISNVKTAIDYEIKRQIELINNGEIIKEQTRRYDEKTKTTVLMRLKETGNDYRYFKEPDLPKVILSDEEIKKIKDNLPILPEQLKSILVEIELNNNNINTLLSNKELSQFLIQVKDSCNPIIASNLLTGEILAYMNKNLVSFKEINLELNDFILLVNKLDKNIISNKQGKEIINKLLTTDIKLDVLIEECLNNSLSDDDISKIIDEVLSKNSSSIVDFKEGKDRALKFLMGQIMKESKGLADPASANKMLIEKLKCL